MATKNKTDIGPWQKWLEMCAAVSDMGEVDCLAALEAEKLGRNRQTFKTRIHNRYNRLRGERERTELLNS